MRATMQEEADYQLRQIEAMRKYGNRNVPKMIREWRGPSTSLIGCKTDIPSWLDNLTSRDLYFRTCIERA